MRLDVWLVGFKPGSTPAKSLAGTFSIDLQEALMLEWSVPTIVGRDLGEGDAESAVRTLRGIGALAEARPVDVTAPLGFELQFEQHEGLRASTPPPTLSKEPDVEAEFGALHREAVHTGESSGDALPSLPAPRRPIVTRAQKSASSPPRRSAERPAPRDLSGELVTTTSAQARAPSTPARSTQVQADKRAVRKSPQTFDPDPPREPLDVGRTERPRGSRRAPQRAQVAMKPEPRGIGPLLPALGAFAVGVGATFITLRRGQTAMLGTADIVGHVLDGLALGCVVLSFVLGFTALFSKRAHFHLAPGVLVLGLAVGATYAVNEWRIPKVGADAELGDEASGLITQSQVSLAGFDVTGARSLLAQLRDAGAISVRGAAPVRFMGAEAYHALAIELPPGPSSRARIVDVFRGAMLLRGGSTSADPSPIQRVWVVSL